jgi:7,8-dihydroneopterin aldolase/epimerase/oxygenase
MHTIHIQNISVYPIIGVYDTERQRPQELLLDLSLTCIQDNLRDDIRTTVDYSNVVPRLVSHIQRTRYFLIETLSEEILTFCLRYPGVEKVDLRLYKPEALKNGLVSITNSKSKNALNSR